MSMSNPVSNIATEGTLTVTVNGGNNPLPCGPHLSPVGSATANDLVHIASKVLPPPATDTTTQQPIQVKPSDEPVVNLLDTIN